MSDPSLLPFGALKNVDVGVSVSNSDDLDRLGLTQRHAELAVGEITRSILVAHGRLVYGGRIKPSGFTQLLLHEVERFGTSRHSLTICLAFPEHRRLSLAELTDLDADLGTWGRLLCLDVDGTPRDFRDGRDEAAATVEDLALVVESLSGLRQFMTEISQARVLVGGQLTSFKGVMPGVIEEAIGSIQAGQALYVAGGFGGAAAAVVRALDLDALEWLPSDMPKGVADPVVEDALLRVSEAAAGSHSSPLANGLTEAENRQLAASHRPGDIASLVVRGLARLAGDGKFTT